MPLSASTGIGRYRGVSKRMENVMDVEDRDWFVGVDWAEWSS